MLTFTSITTYQEPTAGEKTPESKSDRQPEISDSARAQINGNKPGDSMCWREITTTTNAGNNSLKGKNMSVFLRLSSAQQFILLSSTIFVFFGLHNILQEAMMNVPGFPAVMLAYMEVLG